MLIFFTIEAKYASTIEKPIIPLMMETDYKPDGWLGILVSTKLYYKFCSDDEMTASMEGLLKELGNRGRAAASSPATTTTAAVTSQSPPTARATATTSGDEVDGKYCLLRRNHYRSCLKRDTSSTFSGRCQPKSSEDKNVCNFSQICQYKMRNYSGSFFKCNDGFCEYFI